MIKGSDIIHDNIVEYKENSEVMQFEANNISFAYPDKQPLFSHFCLKVYQGMLFYYMDLSDVGKVLC